VACAYFSGIALVRSQPSIDELKYRPQAERTG